MEGRKKILSEHAQHARHEEEIERGIAPPLGEGELLTPDYQVLPTSAGAASSTSTMSEARSELAAASLRSCVRSASSTEEHERRADPVRAHRRVAATFATTVDRWLEPEPSKRPTRSESLPNS